MGFDLDHACEAPGTSFDADRPVAVLRPPVPAIASAASEAGEDRVGGAPDLPKPSLTDRPALPPRPPAG